MSERHVTFDMIVQAVGAVAGVSRHEIMAAGRTTDERAHLRFACWWLADKMTALGLTTIGRLSGDRDHSTIVHGLRRAEELRASSESFRLSTDALLGTLQALERAGLLRFAASIDPLAAARRVLSAPEREAVRVSIYEIVAMSRLIVEQADGEPSEPNQETEHAA
ncbi:dnaA protein helix-turn-helix [Bosea sp. CRIB-10]|uniref:helix-turn-helix domain-containing protein n=1 Tax=Bosea sp. CRIB-10 TaxID=378404 RepID=UPI0008DF3267|nr:helix-turn-helix domain-containing protein [Bosea sp. CRIB-10]SFD72653.1 dnaA protein helix-turn-helix [Bosea sp. CRIB-10]